MRQWIVKVSKLCNLRCDYCYELPELGDRTRMSLAQAAAMFTHIAEARVEADEPLQFVWHGGEPLLQEPSYFRELFALQRKILDGHAVQNVVQTNLTILDDDRLALLRDDFDAVGVSIDLFGEHRRNLAGRPSDERVLANLDRLQAADVPFGCITVLTQRSLVHIDDIFRFYEATNLSFRILPLFAAATAEQTAGFAVRGIEVLDALCCLFDLWLASPTQIQIAPFSELLQGLARRRRGAPPVYYDRRAAEAMAVVNTNGDLYAVADAYRAGTSWGNLFTAPLGEILASPARERSLRDAELRMASACARCEYFGACRGTAIAEDNRHYADAVDDRGTLRCIVERGLCAHIDRRLDELAGDANIERVLACRAPDASTPL